MATYGPKAKGNPGTLQAPPSCKTTSDRKVTHEEQEVSLVVQSDALLDPRTVVVELENTRLTDFTVVCSFCTSMIDERIVEHGVAHDSSPGFGGLLPFVSSGHFLHVRDFRSALACRDSGVWVFSAARVPSCDIPRLDPASAERLCCRCCAAWISRIAFDRRLSASLRLLAGDRALSDPKQNADGMIRLIQEDVSMLAWILAGSSGVPGVTVIHL